MADGTADFWPCPGLELAVENEKCYVCKKEFPGSDLISGHGIRHEIEKMIVRDNPGWDDYQKICRDDYNAYRTQYISLMIEEENGNIKELESDVLRSIDENESIVENVNMAQKEILTIGDAISDRVAKFGGSWKFIILFFMVLAGWIIVNSSFLLTKPFDPFPFILMNLILSCIAAIQAPIIMMSQNRQEKKDRIRSENDYRINLKSEIEIRTLHEKVDHLLLDQWAKMMDIQEMQIEILEEIRGKMK
ncbi:MAG: hypothetical protein CVV51_03505 [Spirochaetae bacterium HGW-Spirochaetae-7]|jgi:uncharacterized membrane protein|nr:MAG: hypothetical protein CVV51_03505 [Spirochaetae bacterium HGW-Spirochaetae-7]